MAYLLVHCRYCNSDAVNRYGYQNGHARFRCKDCGRTFKAEYTYTAWEPGVRERIVDMALNGSGTRDTARALGVGKDTVTATLRKKAPAVVDVNPRVGSREIDVGIRHIIDPPMVAQADGQWGHVGKKKNQRWLWVAIDAATGRVLAFVSGRRTDETFRRLYGKLLGFNIRTWHTDDWQSYSACLPPSKHVAGKRHTQKIENKNLSFRTRIKRLARKTICFSKSELVHDTVIGLYINRYCFQTP